MYRRREAIEETKEWPAVKRKPRKIPSKHVSVAHFDKTQTDELKEAFNLFDQDRDGKISKADLRTMFISLGQDPSESQLGDMMAELTGPVDFTRFLAMFARRMEFTDSEDLIRSAFSCFDKEGDGQIDLADFREILTTRGQRLSDQQVDDVFLNETVTDADGKFRFDDVIKLLKFGSQN